MQKYENKGNRIKQLERYRSPWSFLVLDEDRFLFEFLFETQVQESVHADVILFFFLSGTLFFVYVMSTCIIN